MIQPPNPIIQGLRSVRRDPATLLMEVLWRWAFALLALFLLCIAGAALLQPLHLTDTLFSAVRTQDSRKLALIGLQIVLGQGMKLAIALVAIAFMLALLWSFFAAAARRIIVRRLRSVAPLGFRSMLAVQWLRAMVALFAVLLLMATLAGALYAATRGPQPDLFRFYLVCAPTVPLILVLWLVLNWNLSMVAIFGQEEQSFRAARRQAREAVRRQRSDFAATAFIFLLLRLVPVLVVVAIIGLTSSMMASSPQSYAALVMTVVLAYFVVSDFLYAARIASYLALAAAADASSPSARLTTEKSSPL